MNRIPEDGLMGMGIFQWPGAKVLPGQHNVPQDIIQSLVHKLNRLHEQHAVKLLPACECGIDEPCLQIIEVINPLSITIEDPSNVVYTFELDPARLDILASYTPPNGPCIPSNIMAFQDCRPTLYMTRTLSTYYLGAPVQIMAQTKIHAVTTHLFNQIGKELFPNTNLDRLSRSEFTMVTREYLTRFYYHVSAETIGPGEKVFWNMFEQLMTPEKLFSYIHSRHALKRDAPRITPIQRIADLTEKIDTLARDLLTRIPSSKVPHLTLEQVDKIVDISLLDKFLFPEHAIEKIIESLGPDDAHARIARNYSPRFLAYLLVMHYPNILRTRQSLTFLKVFQYGLIENLVKAGTYDFDTSRRFVAECIERFESTCQSKGEDELRREIISTLFEPFCIDFKRQITQLFLDRKLLGRQEAFTLFAGDRDFSDNVASIERFTDTHGRLTDLDRQIITDKLHTWTSFMDDIASDFLKRWQSWRECLKTEILSLGRDKLIPDGKKDPSTLGDLNTLLCYLFTRVYLNVPRFKDIRKPTVIFIHGGAGVGKSTIGNIISKKLGIPTYFRATITREVLRHFIPKHRAGEVHRSSYQGRPTIEGFYEQSFRVSRAIEAVLDRAIKENTSVMIESGVLLPGTLSSRYYEKANIVEFFLAAPENQITHRRMLVGSVSLGKDKAKRLKNFHPIRLIDFVMKKLARERKITVIEHRDVSEIISEIMVRALNPYSDRWLGMMRESIIEKVTRDLKERDAQIRPGSFRLPITREDHRRRRARFPEEVGRTLKILGKDAAEAIVARHREVLAETHSHLRNLRTQEFTLLRFLLSQVDEPYDHIRQNLFFILNNSRNATQLVGNLKEILYPSLMTTLRRELEQDGYQSEEFLGKGSYESLVYDLWNIPEVKDIHKEKYRSMVKSWGETLERYAKEYFLALSLWEEAYNREEEDLSSHPDILANLREPVSPRQLHEAVRFSYTQTDPEVENLKSLDKPLIILVSGASGVGKSTIAKALKRAFNIPTSFSTDLIREEVRKLVPGEIWPDVHSSSFSLDAETRRNLLAEYERVRGRPGETGFMDRWKQLVLEHYYAHSLVILEGVQAAINRQIERNQSLIIEGIPLIPGTLPGRYFDDSNIVQLIVTISREEEHLGRWDRRALEQPDRYKEGSQRYKQDFIPIRFITRHLEAMAQACSVRVVENTNLDDSVQAAVDHVGGPVADRYDFIMDEIRGRVCRTLAHRTRAPLRFWGAWCTDIDDTVILSGKTPTPAQMQSINGFIRALAGKKAAWVPMSGVAFEKIKPRILDRIEPELRGHVIFYGGDGSSKYLYSPENSTWEKDPAFERLLSDAQAAAIMGAHEFAAQLKSHLCAEENLPPDSGRIASIVETRVRAAQKILKKNGLSPTRGIIDELKDILGARGFDPQRAEAYYRLGSVSWMMLGDIDAQSYASPRAKEVRSELLDTVDSRLKELDFLAGLSPEGTKVIKPFPGARGIKFVLESNSKERCIRDLIENHGLLAEEILFAGNELFEGGNDFVVTNIPGLNLLSFGHTTAAGIPYGEFGVDANQAWYDRLALMLSGLLPDGGETWVSLLARIQRGEITLEILTSLDPARVLP